MAKMSEEVKQAIAQIKPGIIATADKNGKPNVSAKGSFRVIDDEHVAFADIHSPQTIVNLRENPQVAVLVLDPTTRKGARIWGKAEILTSGPLFDRFSQEYGARQSKVNHVVRITVDSSLALTV